MSLTINILYTGTDGSAKKFAEEMMATGIVDKIRKEEGNERYEYYFPLEDPESLLLIDTWKNQEALDIHHKTPMMEEIAALRKKYKLKMLVQRFQTLD
ncbi:MAG: putative quinol monooxygenase [Vagococcus sp.]